MKKIWMMMAFLCVFMETPVWAQELAAIVRAYPEKKNIMVEYDLAVDADLVRLYVSLDGGESYMGPLQQVTGDVSRVKAGHGHRIVWDVLKELETDSFDSDMVRFKLNLKMKERWPQETFVTVNGAYAAYPQLSMGFSVGQVRRFGWFVSVMSNGSFSGLTASDSCSKDGIIDGGYLPGYTGTVSKTRLSLIAGGLMRLSGPWIARVGVGYGNRTLCWEAEDGTWLRNEGYSVRGLEVAAGVQWHWRGFVVSAEAVTTRFKNVEGKIGIGVFF